MLAGAPGNSIASLSLSASAVHDIDTESEAGAAGGIALTPALALSLVDFGLGKVIQLVLPS